MKQYAIIGTGMMGREHISNLALVDDITLTALVDPEPTSLKQSSDHAAKYGMLPKEFNSVEEMMSAVDLDAVIIASPNFTHFSIMKTVMKYSVTILLEKPMCTTIGQARELHALAQQHEGLIWIGQEYRYMPPVTKFIDRVHQGVTGTVNMLSIREHRFPFLPKVGDWNRFSENTGGTLVEKCCHFFDLMRYILQDEPVRVFATGGQDVNHLDEYYDGQRSDILDNAYVLIDFKKGARAVLDLCMFAEGSDEQEEIYVLGDKGKIEVGIPSAKLTWSPRNRSGRSVESVETPKEALAAGDHHGATYFQLQKFHLALKNGTAPEVSTLDGLRAVEIGAAAHRSIETGLPIHLDANFYEKA